MLEYASPVWSPWQVYLLNFIEKVQHHAACYVYNDYHLESSVASYHQRLIIMLGLPETHQIKSIVCIASYAL